MRSRITKILFICGSALAPLTSFAIEELNPKDYDTDKNGSLDEGERRVMYYHSYSALWKAVDTNKDGVMSSTEKLAYFESEVATITSTVEEHVLKEDQRVFKGTSIPLEKANEELAEWINIKSASEQYMPLAGLQIRRSLDDVDGNRQKTRNSKGAYADSLKKVKAAEFGYSNNQVSDDESWFARGVIARPFNLRSSSIVPSISFDRVTHSANPTGEIDSLTFAFSGVTTTGTFGKNNDNFAEFRYGATYATDFDFDTSIPGGFIDLEPIIPALGNGEFEELGPLGWLRTRQFFHLEGGSLEKSKDLTGQEYFRAGGSAGVEFIPKAFPTLSLTADYRYYFDLLGSDDFHSFRPSLTWRLDEVGHLSLQVSYEEGLIPLTHQKVDLFSVGIGIKF